MKTKIKTQFRQGDVLIERVDVVPVGKRVEGRPILAHGEVTGHAHEIEDGSVILHIPEKPFLIRGDLKDAGPMTRLVTKINRRTAVKHQEHGRIPMQRGKYRATRQREYSPEAIRNVAD